MNLIDKIIGKFPRTPLLQKQPYSICMSGPSRIGKTTLITAMLHDFELSSNKIFQQTKKHLVLEPKGATRNRLSLRHDELTGDLIAGKFKPGTLEGTSSAVIFDFLLRETDHTTEKTSKTCDFFSLPIQIHDFPGGWLKEKNPDEFKRQVPYHLADVFIVPTDAALFMEATETKQKQSIPSGLDLKNVTDMVKEWANCIRDNRKGLCIISPVKCETYFTDNMVENFSENKSEQLYRGVIKFYDSMISHLKLNPHIKCLYMPVDTIGCCFLNDKEWIEGDNHLNLKATYYIVPGKNEWKPYGPEEILLEILSFISDCAQSDQPVLNKFFQYMGITPNFISGVNDLKKYSDSYSRFKRTVNLRG